MLWTFYFSMWWKVLIDQQKLLISITQMSCSRNITGNWQTSHRPWKKFYWTAEQLWSMQLKQVTAALIFYPIWSHPLIKGVIPFYLETLKLEAATVFCRFQAISERDRNRFPKWWNTPGAPSPAGSTASRTLPRSKLMFLGVGSHRLCHWAAFSPPFRLFALSFSTIFYVVARGLPLAPCRPGVRRARSPEAPGRREGGVEGVSSLQGGSRGQPI